MKSVVIEREMAEYTQQDFNGWLNRTKERLSFETDKELGDHLGLTADTLSKLYSGRRSPTALNIVAICKSLGIDEISEEYTELLRASQKSRLKMEMSQHKFQKKFRE